MAAALLTLQGPDVGVAHPLQEPTTVLGRQNDSHVCLPGKSVSRRHARIERRNSEYIIEDLDSANGTFVNGRRLSANTACPLTEKDVLQIGPYVLALRLPPPPDVTSTNEPNLVVRETVNLSTMRHSILGADPTARLNAVLEISQNLRTLDREKLLEKLVEQLLTILPQSDRVLVILLEGNNLVVRAERCRHMHEASTKPFSRTIVRKALEEGVGLLSDDVKMDPRFQQSYTLTALATTSVLCVPLITPEGRRLGVIQVERSAKGFGFRLEDLQFLTTIAHQVTVTLENAMLHGELVKEERLLKELALARDIQHGFLPDGLEGFTNPPFEIVGRVYPAREVAGDLYDYFKLPSGKLAFFIGDVSGKGMPAALFMIAVRTLCRHLAKESGSPAPLMARLNDGLADDNPSCMFVTLIHGVYDVKTSEVVLTSAGHPPPILRRADGSVEMVPLTAGRLLGYPDRSPSLSEFRLTLQPGEALVMVTDGLLEAREPGTRNMFGRDRLLDSVNRLGTGLALTEWAESLMKTIVRFTGQKDLQDDLTILMLRRKAEEPRAMKTELHMKR